MQFMMTAKTISSHAEVAILVGLHQLIGGPYKLVYLFRRLRCVHIYECVSHGREWYYSLHLTTDCRYTLRDMQPSTSIREVRHRDRYIVLLLLLWIIMNIQAYSSLIVIIIINIYTS